MMDKYCQQMDFDAKYEIKEHLFILKKKFVSIKKILTRSDVNEIFRAIHSIKGTAKMVQFDNVAKESHEFEDFLIEVLNCNPCEYPKLRDKLEIYCELLLNSLD